MDNTQYKPEFVNVKALAAFGERRAPTYFNSQRREKSRRKKGDFASLPGDDSSGVHSVTASVSGGLTPHRQQSINSAGCAERVNDLNQKSVPEFRTGGFSYAQTVSPGRL
jgi:hypothetical protein